MEFSRRTFIGGAASSLALAGRPAQARAASLGDMAAEKGIVFGSALDYPDEHIFDTPAIAELYQQQCRQFVTGHQFLMGPNKRFITSRFSFDRADRAVNFARASGIPMAGHAAIFHSWVPEWLGRAVANKGARKVIEDHVQDVMGHYKGQMKYWVVVNEPFDWQKRRPDYLIPTPFAEGLGAEYIDVAFAAAAKADPSARLVLNEVGLEYDYPDHRRKRALILETIKRLKSKGIPIHAIGLQSHLRPNFPFSSARLKGFMNEVERLGLKIMITEMDVWDNGLPTDIAQRDKRIAKELTRYLNTVLSGTACDHVMMWGLIHKWNWMNLPAQPVPKGMSQYDFRYPRKDGTPHRPSLFDDDLSPTPAWHAVASALEKARKR
ncbi:endo-1,4-beta-xylanase [Shimia sp. FJ5]|uniref:endo-1,4-beta-xylanase n=1 Tax=Shimia sp. FJ5 TaxID=3079054 RepID=UPI00263182B1|nr:endo-1,4-beta-xylanase [Shimia sp. FJ5]MDV4145226.1 endo-1,4-beta-xylanase [Shimia sp. FJ5]